MKSNGNPKLILKNVLDTIVNPCYIIDSENKQQLNDLTNYFTGVTGRLDLTKGIFLVGNPGSGKTILMEVFSKLIRNLPTAFKIIDCPKASTIFSEYGSAQIKEWSGNWLFDDLGQESISAHFGDKRELMHDIVFEKYNQWRRLGIITHFTSNFGKEDLTKRYGEHFYSRLNQMCNVVLLGAAASSVDRRRMTTPNPTLGTTYPTFFTTEAEIESRQELEQIAKGYEVKKEIDVTLNNVGAGTKMKKLLGDFIQHPTNAETELSKKYKLK